MAREPRPVDRLVLVVGPEELLVERAVRAAVEDAKRADPDVEVHDLSCRDLGPGVLAEAVSPSLFGERRLLVLRDASELTAAQQPEVVARVTEDDETTGWVIAHRGGARGRGLVDAATRAGARRVECAEVKKTADKLRFLRFEARAAHRDLAEDAARALLDAVGGDLRELAASVGQLVADTDGPITRDVVSRYYSGRAEATSFNVADAAVEGRAAEALEQLRWALSVGVAPVLVSSALAQGVRNVIRVGGAGRGARPADLARELGMPPWKVDRVRQQVRGWTGDGLRVAMLAVAEADAAVKGAGTDPAYALEKAVVSVARARQG